MLVTGEAVYIYGSADHVVWLMGVLRSCRKHPTKTDNCGHSHPFNSDLARVSGGQTWSVLFVHLMAGPWPSRMPVIPLAALCSSTWVLLTRATCMARTWPMPPGAA